MKTLIDFCVVSFYKTIVAIRRGIFRIVSPGPYAELYGGDEIIFVGTDEARKAVSGFFSNPES